MTEQLKKPIQEQIKEKVQTQEDPFAWADRILSLINDTDPATRQGLKDRFEELFLGCFEDSLQTVTQVSFTSPPEELVQINNQERHAQNLAGLSDADRILYQRRRNERRTSFRLEKDRRPKVVTVFQRT